MSSLCIHVEFFHVALYSGTLLAVPWYNIITVHYIFKGQWLATSSIGQQRHCLWQCISTHHVNHNPPKCFDLFFVQILQEVTAWLLEQHTHIIITTTKISIIPYICTLHCACILVYHVHTCTCTSMYMYIMLVFFSGVTHTL